MSATIRPRPSRYGRRRAAVLASVYLLMGLHLAHWRIAGRTLAPLELNEVMHTLELGVVTAGFLFMAGALLSAAVFGRFFCSWGCHILALEDLCAWILGRIGLRPRPIRSRALLLVPPAALAYMFVWPQVERMLAGRPLPRPRIVATGEGWSSFVTTDFWRNLPGPWVALSTFAVCGFAIVYVLGSRSFCLFGCPYGVLFALADRIAPGRILARGDCRGCGTCTAVCQSHVRVHEEIAAHGRVLDPACLKDLDCVEACPHGVLAFGFARPAPLLSFRRATRRGMRTGFSLGEEVALALVFTATLLVFRGLYRVVPFLLTLGLGGITAFLAVVALRLLRRPHVRLGRVTLRRSGRLTGAGRLFTTGILAAAGLTLHSGFIRYHESFGDRAFAAVARGLAETGAITDPAEARRALSHLRARERWGLMRPLELDRKLASLLTWGGSPSAAEPHLRRLLAGRPGDLEARLELARVRERAGDVAGAMVELRRALEADDENAFAHGALGELLARRGELEAAAGHLRRALELRPASAPAASSLGAVLAEMGREGEAVTVLGEVVRRRPDDADLRNDLGHLLLGMGERESAAEHLRRSLELRPDSAPAHFNLGRLLVEEGRLDEAEAHLRRAVELDPRYGELLGGPDRPGSGRDPHN